MKKIKLSEFIKMTPDEMSEHLKKCNLTNTVSQVKPSISYEDGIGRESWEKTHFAYDVWSDFEKFNIEIDDCGWEIIPHIIFTFRQYGKTFEEELAECPHLEDSLLLKKVSKYGEILFMSVFYSKRNGIRIVSENINEDRDNYPIILIGDNHSLEHFDGLPVKFRTYEGNHRGNVYNECHVNTVGDFVLFPYLPLNVSIYEYGEAVEKYAKAVSDNNDLYYDEKSKNLDLQLVSKIDKWKSSKQQHLSDEEVDWLNYISLKYMFPDITVDDYNKVHGVLTSEITNVMKFTRTSAKACKEKYYMDLDLYRMGSIGSYFRESSMYEYVIKSMSDVNIGILAAMFAKIDKFRQLDVNAVNTKKRQEEAEKEYEIIRNAIAYSYEKELATEYKRIVSELTRIEKVYNAKMVQINEEMTQKYADVDLRRIVWDDDPVCLTSGLKKSLAFIGTEAGAFGSDDIFTKIIGLDKLSASAKKHLAKVFELNPDIDQIIISSIHKSYDAPYEIYLHNDFDDNNQDIVEMMIEKCGQKVTDKWIEKFESFDFSDKLSENDGNDLYPGCGRDLVINRNFEFDYIDFD